MSGSVILAAILSATGLALLVVWVRTWRRWRRARLAEQQLQDEMRMRRGWRELQRRKLLDREMQR